uniref:Head-to-tail adaptor n=1 Tax=Micrococcus phage Kurnik TaxID=3092208 RepID=A0AAU6R687_9CAUD
MVAQSPLTLAVNLRLTKEYIEFDPVELVLTPRVGVPDGEGGIKKTLGTPREPQTFSLIEPGNSGFQQPIVTDTGSQYTIDFMLLGEVSTVFEKDDVFVHDGHEYKILEIMPFNGYERRGVVIRHGW